MDTEKKLPINDRTWWQKPLAMFSRLSTWIIVPIIIAALAGNWLDAKYQTKPWIFLGLIGLAIIVSSIGITKNAIIYLKSIDNSSDNKK
jgi:hypothetical protein